MNLKLNPGMHRHTGTVRLLLAMIAIVVVGALALFGLEYVMPSSGTHTVIATSTPSVLFPIASTTASAPSTVDTNQDVTGVSTSSPITTGTGGVSGSQNSSTSSTPTKPNGPTVLTNSDNNTTVQLTKGQDFTVELGNDLNWTLSFDPAKDVAKLSGLANEQSQGTYEAEAPGTVTLKGSGAPICTPEEACPQFLAVFTVTLVIQ